MLVPAPPAGVLLAATQAAPFQVCQVAIAFQLPVAALRKSPLAALTVMDGLVPVFPLASEAVMVMVSATMSLVLIVNVPFDNVCVLSTKLVSPLASNCTVAVLPFMVTTVELSATTVLVAASTAVTVTRNGTSWVC